MLFAKSSEENGSARDRVVMKKSNMKIVLKTIFIWLIMVLFAIINGTLREKLLAPIIGQNISLPLSGIFLSIVIILVVYFSIPFFGNNTSLIFALIGIGLVLMTLSFEFLFGHYFVGKSWETILQVFNVLKGDLFIVLLLASLLSPYYAARFRGFMKY